MKVINRLFCILFLTMLTSCMNTEILPLKFYKEEFPLKIDDNFIMSDLFFNNIYQEKSFYLWNIEKRYISGDGITTFIYYKNGYFPYDSDINLNLVTLIFFNNEKLEYNIIKKTEAKDYFIYEEDNDGKIISNSLYKKDGKIIIDSGKRIYAPDGFVGEYTIEVDFKHTIELKDIKEIELFFTIKENGLLKERVKTIHPDFKYKYVTKPMFIRWAESH